MSALDELVYLIECAQAVSDEPIKCLHFGERTYIRLRQEVEFARPLDLRFNHQRWYGIPFRILRLPNDVNLMRVELEAPVDTYEIGRQVFEEMARKRDERG